MAFCKNCGAELAEDQKFCANCGNAVESEAAPAKAEEPAVVEEPVTVEAPVAVAEPVAAEEPVKAGLNVGMLVWSIIGIVVCSPFSIPALIMTILAINMPVAEAEKKIKLARTFNIISIVCGVLYFVYFVVVVTLGVLTELAEASAFML